MEEKKINKRIVFSVVAVLLLIAVVAGATYAFFSAGASSAAQTVTTATMDLAFDDSTAIVNATNITPMRQAEIQTKAAKKSFKVTNNGTQPMYLQMKLTDINMDPQLKDLWFRWALYEEGTRIGMGTFYQAGTEVFMQQNMELQPGSKNYDLYIWIEESDENQNALQGKSFSGKVTVNGSIAEYEGVEITINGQNQNNWTTEIITDTYETNLQTIGVPKSNNHDMNDLVSGDFTKFTNLTNLEFSFSTMGDLGTKAFPYPSELPISLENLYSSGGKGMYDFDFSHLTNLKKLEVVLYAGTPINNNIKLPSSLQTLNIAIAHTSPIGGTFDFSNLVNLTKVEGFNFLSSDATVILPASIKDTVTIGSGAFGSANVVYQ